MIDGGYCFIFSYGHGLILSNNKDILSDGKSFFSPKWKKGVVLGKVSGSLILYPANALKVAQ